MSLCRADVELLEQWSATGVPEDRSTRDFACRLLLKVWADRCEWIAIVDELMGLTRGGRVPEGEPPPPPRTKDEPPPLPPPPV